MLSELKYDMTTIASLILYLGGPTTGARFGRWLKEQNIPEYEFATAAELGCSFLLSAVEELHDQGIPMLDNWNSKEIDAVEAELVKLVIRSKPRKE